MRRALFTALAAALILAPAIGVAQSPDSASQHPSGDDSRLLTPQQEGRQGIVKGVVEQPFRDFNLVRSKIPEVLLEAVSDAYQRPGPGCDSIAIEVHRLDLALGPDLDEPVDTVRPSTVTRGEQTAKSAGLDAMRAGVQAYIPFDGAIRVVTGADHHDHRVMAAIEAGAIRRAYLKGLGEARNCAVPGVPRHLARPVSVAATDAAY